MTTEREMTTSERLDLLERTIEELRRAIADLEAMHLPNPIAGTDEQDWPPYRCCGYAWKLDRFPKCPKCVANPNPKWFSCAKCDWTWPSAGGRACPICGEAGK